MHPLVAHKWACLALLCGLSTTLARPLVDDDLFAFAPVDGGNTFTSDTLPIDGGAEPLPFDDFSQDPLGLSSFGNSALLGSDPSIGSGFDVAYAVGDCKLGEVVQDVGSVAFAGACPAEFNLKGCGRTSAAVINFDDRLPLLCSTANQKCCGGVSSAVFDGLTDCHEAPQPVSIIDQLGQSIQGGWSGLVNGNPGGNLGPSGSPNGILQFFGIGNEKKKRSNDFCGAPGYL